MRPFLAILIVASTLGGLAWYMSSREQVQAEDFEQSFADGEFRLELTATFDAGPDPFGSVAVDSDTAVMITRGNEVVFEHRGTVAAGEVLLTEPLQKVIVGSNSFRGRNEFQIKVTPSSAAATVGGAVRVRVLRDEHELGDATTVLWGDPGQPVEGPIVFSIVAVEGGDSHSGHVQRGDDE